MHIMYCVYFSRFQLKLLAPCYGILGNNLLGMLKCLSLKYYPSLETCVIDDADAQLLIIVSTTSGQQIKSKTISSLSCGVEALN